MNATRRFVPALKYTFLTPAYDILIRLTIPERTFKNRLLIDAQLRPGDRVLDVGCGTGTLLLMAKRLEPNAELIGIDADPEILGIAWRKFARARVQIHLETGYATSQPFSEGSFDRVFSTLAIHHLPGDEKRRAFHEIARVLRQDGTFHLADFGPPADRTSRVISWLMEHVGGEYVQENFRGELPAMLFDAGFTDVIAAGRFRTAFGTIELLSGHR
jgi:ubiquinone/menaquinone biosynthesis C-methylase UbiE